MVNLNLILFISFVAPLLIFLAFFKGTVRKIFVFFILGLTLCLLCGELNGLVMNNLEIDYDYITINIIPIIEEIIKALPILIYAFCSKPKVKDILLCALAIGIGFSVLENAFILAVDVDNATLISAVFRGFGAGMMHALCSFMVGYGLSFVRKSSRLAICGTFALLALAIMYHSTYNCIVQSNYSHWGIILPFVTFIGLLILFKAKPIE